MESSIHAAVRVIQFMAGLVWLGALVFIGFRVYQMRTLPAVEAEVLRAETDSYVSKSYRRNAAGWNEETRTRMYTPTALVRYEYDGKVITAEAAHDVGLSWRWVQDRLTRQWKSGSRIRIHIDPAKPDKPLAGLGMNLNTFIPAAFLVGFGFFLAGCGYGLTRIGLLVTRLTGNFGPSGPGM